ncbi:hypothetical protein ACLBXM_11865 [Xanthobacteraceae bacterium A53D]
MVEDRQDEDRGRRRRLPALGRRWPGWVQPFFFTIATCVFSVTAFLSARDLWILVAEGRFRWQVGPRKIWVLTSEAPDLYWHAFWRLSLELLFSLFWIGLFLFVLAMIARRKREDGPPHRGRRAR